VTFGETRFRWPINLLFLPLAGVGFYILANSLMKRIHPAPIAANIWRYRWRKRHQPGEYPPPQFVKPVMVGTANHSNFHLHFI